MGKVTTANRAAALTSATVPTGRRSAVMTGGAGALAPAGVPLGFCPAQPASKAVAQAKAMALRIYNGIEISTAAIVKSNIN